MKNLVKYSVITGMLLTASLAANAAVTVEETTTPEFIHNAGYSSEISRIIDVKTKDPSTPIPAETKKDKTKNFGWYVMQTIDPAVNRPHSFADHQIKYGRSMDDL